MSPIGHQLTLLSPTQSNLVEKTKLRPSTAVSIPSIDNNVSPDSEVSFVERVVTVRKREYDASAAPPQLPQLDAESHRQLKTVSWPNHQRRMASLAYRREEKSLFGALIDIEL